MWETTISIRNYKLHHTLYITENNDDILYIYLIIWTNYIVEQSVQMKKVLQIVMK